jgi:hypothetical protein
LDEGQALNSVKLSFNLYEDSPGSMHRVIIYMSKGKPAVRALHAGTKGRCYKKSRMTLHFYKNDISFKRRYLLITSKVDFINMFLYMSMKNLDILLLIKSI